MDATQCRNVSYLTNIHWQKCGIHYLTICRLRRRAEPDADLGRLPAAQHEHLGVGVHGRAVLGLDVVAEGAQRLLRHGVDHVHHAERVGTHVVAAGEVGVRREIVVVGFLFRFACTVNT